MVNTQRVPIIGILIAGLVISMVGVGVAVAAIETVDEGHEKVVKYKGDSKGIFKPGEWHYINPITQGTQTLDVRPQKMTFSDEVTEGEKNRDDSIKVITSDDVRVPVNLQVTYKITDSKKFYETWKNHANFRARVLYPGVEDGVLEVGGGTKSSEIATDTGRQAMRKAAKDELDARAEGTGATVMSVSIKKVNLPDKITDAAAKAQAKDQELEAKQKEIKIAKAEAERKLIEAKGQRDADLTRAEAYRKEGVIEAMYIEKLDETDTVYIPVGSEGLPRHLDVNTDGNPTAEENSTTGNSTAGDN